MINKLLSRENKDNITLFTLLTFSLAIWLITRPFSGVIHDNVLYALQALHILEPKNYKNDLFFLFIKLCGYGGFFYLDKWKLFECLEIG